MSSELRARHRRRSERTPIGLLLIAGVLVAVSQVGLDGLADGNITWHWIQHGTLFAGGFAAGAAAVLLYSAGRARG